MLDGWGTSMRLLQSSTCLRIPIASTLALMLPQADELPVVGQQSVAESLQRQSSHPERRWLDGEGSS